MLLSFHGCISEWMHTLYLPECQGTSCSKQAQYLNFKWLQGDSNPQPTHFLSKEFLDIQANIECGFTLKCVRDMITTYSQEYYKSIKRIWFRSTVLVKIHKVFIAYIWWMIECNVLKLSFVWNFHNKIMCRI